MTEKSFIRADEVAEELDVSKSYLADIEQQAQDLFLWLVKELAEKENVTEELKATDMMLWVRNMNNIRNRATEIVCAELIYF